MKKKITAIVLAAGKGSRMNSDTPKQFMMLGDFPVIYYSLKTFSESIVDDIVLVTGSDSLDYCKTEILAKYDFTKVTNVVAGGAERYDSVYNGLCKCVNTDYVMIHDGARPFVTVDMINRSIDTLVKYDGCAVGVPVKDTIKVVDGDGIGIATPDRNTLWQIQTPQSFHYDKILSAYQEMRTKPQDNVVITDDTTIAESYGKSRIKVIFGDYSNIKITTPEDLKIGLEFLEKSC